MPGVPRPLPGLMAPAQLLCRRVVTAGREVRVSEEGASGDLTPQVSESHRDGHLWAVTALRPGCGRWVYPRASLHPAPGAGALGGMRLS